MLYSSITFMNVLDKNKIINGGFLTNIPITINVINRIDNVKDLDNLLINIIFASLLFVLLLIINVKINRK